MKAMGLGLGAFGFHEVSVQRAASGAPSLIVIGASRTGRRARRDPLASQRQPSPTWSRWRTWSPSEPASYAAGVIPVVTPAEMRAIDAAAPEPAEQLIDRAGAAVACAARSMLGGTYGRVVNVIVGLGNNGPMDEWPPNDSPRRRQGSRLRGRDMPSGAAAGRPGHRRRLRHRLPRCLAGARHRRRRCWRSTSRAGSTATPGRRTAARSADVTVTFAAAKPGLYLGMGRELAYVRVVDIGLDVSSATAHVVEASDVAQIGRDGNAHKWAQAVRVVAGIRHDEPPISSPPGRSVPVPAWCTCRAWRRGEPP